MSAGALRAQELKAALTRQLVQADTERAVTPPDPDEVYERERRQILDTTEFVDADGWPREPTQTEIDKLVKHRTAGQEHVARKQQANSNSYPPTEPPPAAEARPLADPPQAEEWRPVIPPRV